MSQDLTRNQVVFAYCLFEALEQRVIAVYNADDGGIINLLAVEIGEMVFFCACHKRGNGLFYPMRGYRMVGQITFFPAKK